MASPGQWGCTDAWGDRSTFREIRSSRPFRYASEFSHLSLSNLSVDSPRRLSKKGRPQNAGAVSTSCNSYRNGGSSRACRKSSVLRAFATIYHFVPYAVSGIYSCPISHSHQLVLCLPASISQPSSPYYGCDTVHAAIAGRTRL